MVSAQEPVERNKSSLRQAVVWLWTRQSLLTDKLCLMREDRSRAHVLRALTGQIKSPSVWWFLFLFNLFIRETIKKNRYSDIKRKGKFSVFSNGWPIKISEEGSQNTSEGDETESLVWGGRGGGPRQPCDLESPGIMDGSVWWIRELCRWQTQWIRNTGDDVRGLQICFPSQKWEKEKNKAKSDLKITAAG